MIKDVCAITRAHLFVLAMVLSVVRVVSRVVRGFCGFL